jgi:hypothetical protein
VGISAGRKKELRNSGIGGLRDEIQKAGFYPALICYFVEKVRRAFIRQAPASKVAAAGVQNYQDSEELLLLESLFSGLLAFSFLSPLPSLELLLG